MSQDENIVQVGSVRPHTSNSRRRRVLIAIILIGALGGGIYYYLNRSTQPEIVSISSYETAAVTTGSLVSTTDASGTVVLPKQITIMSPENGYVASLEVAEGDTVSTTDVLAVLEVPDLEDKRDGLEIQLRQANLELENLRLEYAYTIRNLEISLERFEDDIDEARQEVEKMEELSTLRSSRVSDYESAVEELDRLLESKEDLLLAIEEQKAKENISIRKQEATIQQLNVDLAQVLEDIDGAHITSPIAGEILSINEDLEITGSYIQERDPLFVVADRSEVYVDLDVYEQYAECLEIGDIMTVTVGTSTMEAEIVRIGKIASMDTDGLSATITVRARPITEAKLTPGASAVASMVLGIQEDTLLLPRGAYLTTGNQKYVYVVHDDKAYKTKVTYGNIQGTDVEIIEGVSEGDIIITSTYQSFIGEDVIQLHEQ